MAFQPVDFPQPCFRGGADTNSVLAPPRSPDLVLRIGLLYETAQPPGTGPPLCATENATPTSRAVRITDQKTIAM
jgi:hypothetical protein